MSGFPSVAEPRATITLLSCVDSGLTDAERIDLLRACEELKNALSGVRAVLTVELASRAAQSAHPAEFPAVGMSPTVASLRSGMPADLDVARCSDTVRDRVVDQQTRAKSLSTGGSVAPQTVGPGF